MLWTITALTFLATLGIVGALLYAFGPGDVRIAGRLSRLLSPEDPVEETDFRGKQRERVQNTLASVGKLVSSPQAQSPKAQLLMVRAGYRSNDALWTMRGVKVLLPISLIALSFFSGIYKWNPILVFGAAFLLGYLLPDFWLTWRIRSRQHRLRLALPDGLDLLVICVEAGLGLDQALMRVSQELRVAHSELSDELQLVNFEMRVGKTRLEALRELGQRTGLDDIKALVAMLIQTDRFGTSVAQALRVHSDELRMKRRQRAEEMAAKTTVKMVPVLVFFIFPAMMVVILGPAVIAIMRQLLHV
jgi:tight adherence protein C